MTPIQHALAFSHWLQGHQTALLVSVGGILVVVVVLAALGARHERGRQTHGSSRWATWREAQRAGLVRRHGYPLGMLGRETLRVVQRHILLVAPTGAGKDRAHNFPFTASCPWSMVIVDIKNNEAHGQRTGESVLHCGRYRQRLGPVYRLAPGDPESQAWNPLDSIRKGTEHEFRDVMVCMQSLLDPRKKDTTASDAGSYFERSGAIAGRGVLLYELHTAAAEKATLTHCHTLMNTPRPTLAAMQAHAHPEVQAQGRRLGTMLREAERQFTAEWSTAQLALDLFSDPAIAAITSRSDFALTDLQFGHAPDDALSGRRDAGRPGVSLPPVPAAASIHLSCA